MPSKLRRTRNFTFFSVLLIFFIYVPWKVSIFQVKPTTNETSPTSKESTSKEKTRTSKELTSNEKTRTSKELTTNKKTQTSKEPTSNETSPTSKEPTSNEKTPTSKEPTSNEKTRTSKEPTTNKKNQAQNKFTTNKKNQAQNKPTTNKKSTINKNEPKDQPICPELMWDMVQESPLPEQGNIPPIVHYVYKNAVIPVQYFALIKNCVKLNPNITFVLWTDAEIEHLMKNHYNGSYYEVYRSYTYGIEKADVARIFIIHAFGGIYMDMDMECKKPFMNFLKNVSCILDHEQELQTQILYDRKYFAMNSVMACTPRHPFFERLINKLKKDNKKIDILEKAGPSFLTRQYEEYHQLSANQNSSLSVTLADPNNFSPFVDVWFGHVKILCTGKLGKWKAVGCKNVPIYQKNKKRYGDKAVLIHKFLHLGWKHYYKLKKKHINLCGEKLNIRRFS